MNFDDPKFRIIKRKSDGLVYVSMADLIAYFDNLEKNYPKSTSKQLIEHIIGCFRKLIYERIDQ